jgi:hypothetical protein
LRKADAAPNSGSLELRENRGDGAVLGALGFVGIIPLTAWAGAIILSLPTWVSAGGTSWQNGPIGLVVGSSFVFGMFAIPISVPIWILRSRQKNGARLTWDDDGVVEYDGAWKRNAIPWSRMEVAHVAWVLPGRNWGRVTYDVVQLFDRSSNAVITAWQGSPSGTPIVRRRVIALDLPGFIAMLRNRKIPFSQIVDYTRAEDPDRHRMTGARLALARLGYVGALLGPMVAFPAPIPGVIISVIAAGLLAWRATPSIRELRIVSSRIRRAGASFEGEPEKIEAYREASAPPVSLDVGGRLEVDRIKRVAVRAEVAMRSAFVLLTLFAGVANALHSG